MEYQCLQFQLIDGLTPETEKEILDNELQEVFVNGKFVRTQTFDEIRKRVEVESKRVYGEAL
ncbi:MAG: hypothetical protein HFJ42_01365 [Clostridia bacterium]|nr:hypothetical protein [Clostridia bacterium]